MVLTPDLLSSYPPLYSSVDPNLHIHQPVRPIACCAGAEALAMSCNRLREQADRAVSSRLAA